MARVISNKCSIHTFLKSSSTMSLPAHANTRYSCVLSSSRDGTASSVLTCTLAVKACDLKSCMHTAPSCKVTRYWYHCLSRPMRLSGDGPFAQQNQGHTSPLEASRLWAHSASQHNTACVWPFKIPSLVDMAATEPYVLYIASRICLMLHVCLTH